MLMKRKYVMEILFSAWERPGLMLGRLYAARWRANLASGDSKKEVTRMETRLGIRRFIILLAILAFWLASLSSGQTASTESNRTRLVVPNPTGVARFPLLTPNPAVRASDFLASDPSGWVDLMPHKSLKGWTRMTVPPGQNFGSHQPVELDKEHGTILCEGNHGHEWLRYDHELANFLLHVEWRFEKRKGRRVTTAESLCATT